MPVVRKVKSVIRDGRGHFTSVKKEAPVKAASSPQDGCEACKSTGLTSGSTYEAVRCPECHGSPFGV